MIVAWSSCNPKTFPTCICHWNSNRNTICRPYVCVNFYFVCLCVVHGMRKRNSLSLFPRPALPPSLGDWLRNDLQLIMHRVSVGSCCCLLILSFTYNRHVLFTQIEYRTPDASLCCSCVCLLMQLVASPDFLNVGYYLGWSAQLALPQGAHHLQRNKSVFSSVLWISFGQLEFLQGKK